MVVLPSSEKAQGITEDLGKGSDEVERFGSCPLRGGDTDAIVKPSLARMTWETAFCLPDLGTGVTEWLNPDQKSPRYTCEGKCVHSLQIVLSGQKS